MSTEVGKWLIGAGLLILLLGLLFYFFGDKLGWMGRLPGDIRVEKKSFSFYFPVTTMIIISIVLSVIFTIIVRLFRE